MEKTYGSLSKKEVEIYEDYKSQHESDLKFFEYKRDAYLGYHFEGEEFRIEPEKCVLEICYLYINDQIITWDEMNKENVMENLGIEPNSELEDLFLNNAKNLNVIVWCHGDLPLEYNNRFSRNYKHADVFSYYSRGEK